MMLFRNLLTKYKLLKIINNYEEIILDKGIAKIINTNCVNSNHKARFLANDNDDYCQCSFGECKVRVDIEYNRHSSYRYILTEKEIEDLPTN